jgi:hypothetical protein
MMNEKISSVLVTVLFCFLFLVIGAIGGWFGHRASIANRPVDTDTTILQERNRELEKRQQDIDSAFGRGFELLDEGTRAVSDSKGDAIRFDDGLERIGDGLDNTIRDLEAVKRNGNSASQNPD